MFDWLKNKLLKQKKNRMLHMPRFDYYCDAVELVKNSKLSDKDKKETLERMERAVFTPPYKIFSKENFNYLKSKLEKLDKNKNG